MKRPVNILNLLDEHAAEDVLSGRLPIKVIYRDQLAERLGVTPKERLAMTLVLMGELVFISALVDGGDLTPAQNDIFTTFLRETGAFTAVFGPIPERPIAS